MFGCRLDTPLQESDRLLRRTRGDIGSRQRFVDIGAVARPDARPGSRFEVANSLTMIAAAGSQGAEGGTSTGCDRVAGTLDDQSPQSCLNTVDVAPESQFE